MFGSSSTFTFLDAADERCEPDPWSSHRPTEIDACDSGGESSEDEGGGAGRAVLSTIRLALGAFFSNLKITDSDYEDSVSGSDATKSVRSEAQIDEDFLCPICLMLLYQPVTTPCGHTFCHDCIQFAQSLKTECPVCRCVYQPPRPSLSVNMVLRNLISKTHPRLYARRAQSQNGCSFDPMLATASYASSLTASVDASDALLSDSLEWDSDCDSLSSDTHAIPDSPTIVPHAHPHSLAFGDTPTPHSVSLHSRRSRE